MKECANCKQTKPLEEFYKAKRNSHGRSYFCIACQSIKRAMEYQENKEKINEQNKEWYRNNKEKRKDACLRWASNNKEARNKIYDKYVKAREKIDPVFSLGNKVSLVLIRAIKSKGYRKSKRTEDILGCTTQQFHQHMGPKPGTDFDIDHICPISQAKTVEEVYLLNHYINLRWLSHAANVARNDKKDADAEEMCKKLLGREWLA